jgi:hypothetical protein
MPKPKRNEIKMSSFVLQKTWSNASIVFLILRNHPQYLIISSFKGSLTRDFRLQVFFLNQSPSGP